MTGCSGGRGPAAGNEGASALPDALTCDGALPPGEKITAEASAEPPRRPQVPLSEAGEEGRRLFVARRWDSAIPLLRNAASGRAGDDRANRDVSQFRLAVALLFTGQDSEGKALLGVIARDPAHAARPDMLVWLSEDAIAHPGLAHYFGGFDDTDIAAVKGPEALRSKLSYFIGRERFERGTYADAMFFFSQVKRESKFSRYALTCVAKIDAKTKAAQPTQARR